MIRVLVVDDERPARNGLRLRLESMEGFQVVGEAATGRAAVAAVLKLAPDLILLDIRLPDMNGFEVMRRIPEERRPRVVFVTAYDHHALEAFEVHALDYVMKPIVDRRLRAALERARIAHVHAIANRTLETMADALRQGTAEASGSPLPARLDRLMVRDGARLRIVPVSAIHWIEATGNYVTLHVGGREWLHRVTLNELEAQLPVREFARVHRGAIVNVAEIAEIHPTSHGDAEILLRNGTAIRMSRRYRGALG